MNPTTTSSGARPLFAVVLPNILAGQPVGARRPFPEADVAVFHDFGAYEASAARPLRPLLHLDRGVRAAPRSVPAASGARSCFDARPCRACTPSTPMPARERLVHALMRLHCGRPPRGPRHGGARIPAPALPARETEVLAHIARGLANKTDRRAPRHRRDDRGIAPPQPHGETASNPWPDSRPRSLRPAASRPTSSDRHKSTGITRLPELAPRDSPPESPAATRSQASLPVVPRPASGTEAAPPAPGHPPRPPFSSLHALRTRRRMSRPRRLPPHRLFFFVFTRSDSPPHVRPRRLPRPASPLTPVISRPPAASLEIEDCRTAKKILTLHPETKKTDPAHYVVNTRTRYLLAALALLTVCRTACGACGMSPNAATAGPDASARTAATAQPAARHPTFASPPGANRPATPAYAAPAPPNPHPHRPRQRHAHGPTVRGPGRPADRQNGRKSYRHGGQNGRQNG